MTSFRPWLLAVLIACVAMPLTIPTAVSAQESTDEQARRHFRLGQAHYENGSFVDAAHEFEEAYRLSNRAQLLYNVYVAYRDAGDLQHSRDALRMYLEGVPDAENASMLRARLEALDRMLAQGATETTTTTTTEPATDTTSATTTTTTTTTDAAADETTDEIETEATEPSGGASLSPFPFVVAGAGAALMIAGAITGGVALGTQSSLDERCPDRACPAGVDYVSERDTGKALAITTDVLLITGGVALAAGIAWLIVELTGSSSSEQPPVAAACGPDGCMASAHVEF